MEQLFCTDNNLPDEQRQEKGSRSGGVDSNPGSGCTSEPLRVSSLGLWNMAPHAGWLEATEIHSLIALEVEVPNQRFQPRRSLLEAQRSALCLFLSSASIRGIACFVEVSLHLCLS